jgi:hypothetical protein
LVSHRTGDSPEWGLEWRIWLRDEHESETTCSCRAFAIAISPRTPLTRTIKQIEDQLVGGNAATVISASSAIRAMNLGVLWAALVIDDELGRIHDVIHYFTHRSR